MTTKPDTNTSQTGSPDAQINESASEALASDALARRRLLLKSLGKGSSVILAAAVPMHTLAAPSTRSLAIVDVVSLGTGEKAVRCSVSGFQSLAHSKVSANLVCTGKKIDKYNTSASWPTGACGQVAVTKTTKFNLVFTSSNSTKTMFEEVVAGKTNGHWVVALLNSFSNSTNFPYTPMQIKDFYAADPSSSSKAYLFFTGYMETR